MKTEGERSPLSHPPSLVVGVVGIVPSMWVFSRRNPTCNTVDAPITWLLRMTCASAVLSHVISYLLLSCDRISIKLQLTGKSCLIFQLKSVLVVMITIVAMACS